MGSKKSSQTTTHKVPDYIEDTSKQAVNLGSKIASRPYEAYTGERYAPMSANEQAGINLAANSAGQPQQYIDKAAANLSSVQSFTDADMSKYQNPYTKGVLDTQIRDINAAAGQAERAMAPNLSAGSSGDILAKSALQKNLLTSIGDATVKGRSESFNNAVKTWSGDQDMKMRAADAWKSTAGNVQQMNTQQMRDLMMTGGAARAVAQLNKDFDYQSFVEARDWDITNLGPLLESLKVPHNSSDTTVTKSGSNVFGQVLGLAGTVIGGMYGGPQGAAMGAKIGSSVGGG